MLRLAAILVMFSVREDDSVIDPNFKLFSQSHKSEKTDSNKILYRELTLAHFVTPDKTNRKH